MKNKQKKIYASVFIIYSIFMIWLLFGQRAVDLSFDSYFERISQNYNVIPFRTIKEFIENYHHSSFYFINLAGNVVMFVPLGFLLPATFEQYRHFGKASLESLCILLTVETLQFFTLLGSWDIDDIILNMLGVFIGYLFYYLTSKLIKKLRIGK